MAKRPCRNYPRCTALVDRGGYCEGCSAKGCGKDTRPSAAKRGYGSRWAKASKGYLAKNPWCVDPYKRHQGRLVPATDTDHIVPVSGPDDPLFWDSNNWQGLCESDHSMKTAREDGGFGHRRG